MAEFTELPVAAGGLPIDNLWDELRNAIANRREYLNDFPGFIPGAVPTDLSVGDIWRRIIQYRAAIDAITEYFYIETELVAGRNTTYIYIQDTGATTASADDSLTDVGKFIGYTLDDLTCTITESTGGGTGIFTIINNTDDKLTFTADPGDGVAVAYIISTLHVAAFGTNDWDPIAAPDLTPPTLSHKKLWNDIKACLDLMKWVNAVPYQLIGRIVTWGSQSVAPADHHNPPWAAALAAHYATMPALANTINQGVGRWTQAQLIVGGDNDGDYNFNWFQYLQSGRNEPFDFSGYAQAPSIIDSYTRLTWDANPGFDYYQDITWEVVLGHASLVSVSNAPTISDPEVAGEGWNKIAAARLGDIKLDGTDNEIRFVYSPIEDWDIPPNVADWPAPAGAAQEDYWQMLSGPVTGPRMDWYLKLSWA